MDGFPLLKSTLLKDEARAQTKCIVFPRRKPRDSIIIALHRDVLHVAGATTSSFPYAVTFLLYMEGIANLSLQESLIMSRKYVCVFTMVV